MESMAPMALTQRGLSSEALVSMGRGDAFVESATNGRGQRRGPPGVQWNETRDRQYARMYSICNIHTDDLPLFLKDDGFDFR
jgi:hypothetical protein